MSQFPGVTRKTVLGYSTDEKVTFNFFNMVYSWMAVGLAVTAVVAWTTSHSAAMMQFIYGSGRGMLIVFSLAAFGIAFAAGVLISRLLRSR